MRKYIKYINKNNHILHGRGNKFVITKTYTKRICEQNLLEFAKYYNNLAGVQNYIYTILEINGIEYLTKITKNILSDIPYIIYFFSNLSLESPIFLSIYFNDMDDITTNYDFPTFHNKTKLDTIIDIIDIVYSFFCIDKIELTDVAHFKCPGKKLDNKLYPAILYRIFNTDKQIDDISIYQKYGFILPKCDSENLQFVRTYLVKNFLLGCVANKIQADVLPNLEMKYQTQDDKNITMHDFFKKYISMNTIELCENNIKYFDLLEYIARNEKIYNNDYDIYNFANKLKKLVYCLSQRIKKNEYKNV